MGKLAIANVFLLLVFYEVLQCQAAIMFISCLMTWFSKFCFQSLCFTLLCLYVLLVFVFLFSARVEFEMLLGMVQCYSFSYSHYIDQVQR